eukprot:2981006-Rhodomonas_salina.1
MAGCSSRAHLDVSALNLADALHRQLVAAAAQHPRQHCAHASKTCTAQTHSPPSSSQTALRFQREHHHHASTQAHPPLVTDVWVSLRCCSRCPRLLKAPLRSDDALSGCTSLPVSCNASKRMPLPSIGWVSGLSMKERGASAMFSASLTCGCHATCVRTCACMCPDRFVCVCQEDMTAKTEPGQDAHVWARNIAAQEAKVRTRHPGQDTENVPGVPDVI